jgi:hypothetical protein
MCASQAPVATPVVQQHVASGASGSHVDGKGTSDAIVTMVGLHLPFRTNI